MIRFKHKGNFRKAKRYFRRLMKLPIQELLEIYGKYGVRALQSATPKDTGETANSWGYEVETTDGKSVITWTNTHVHDGVVIALILQYGHGTGTGGWVEGLDYINPALRPTFEDLAAAAWREVTSK